MQNWVGVTLSHAYIVMEGVNHLRGLRLLSRWFTMFLEGKSKLRRQRIIVSSLLEDNCVRGHVNTSTLKSVYEGGKSVQKWVGVTLSHAYIAMESVNRS